MFDNIFLYIGLAALCIFMPLVWGTIVYWLSDRFQLHDRLPAAKMHDKSSAEKEDIWYYHI